MGRDSMSLVVHFIKCKYKDKCNTSVFKFYDNS